MNILSVLSKLGFGRSRRTASLNNANIPSPMPDYSLMLESELEGRMTEFMEGDYFSLFLQPVVELSTGRVCGGEILSRLNHPERGLIFPNVFLPVISRLELQVPFDLYIFRKSCAWMSRSQGLERISVNFSRKTLCRRELTRELTAIVDRYGVAPGTVAIEITESEKETDEKTFLRNLTELKEAGFGVFLDDYGTGFTAITDLQRLPLEIVKIDRSLLLNAEDSDEGTIIFRSLVEMAAKLGIDAVCEGIETESQERIARDNGCRYAQGFLYYRPVNADDALAAVARGSIGGDEG